ncbi:MAG: TolC family protein [Longimicrobiales bacterium]
MLLVPSRGIRGIAMAAFLMGSAVPAMAQTSAPATLTLKEAIDLARRNNPDYLQQANDGTVANWAVRDAYGNLLPNAQAGVVYGYQAAGSQRIGNIPGIEASSTDYYSSSASLNINYSLSGQSLLAPGQAKSNRRATLANIELAGFNLEANVVRQYLAVLRSQETVILAGRELANAKENEGLADARVATGSAIPMESKQAAVQVGRAEVGVLQAKNAVQIDKMRLMQTMGVQFTGDFQLTTSFGVTDIPGTLPRFLDIAIASHPTIRAAHATDAAAVSSYKMAKTAYLPSLNLSTGWSGFLRQAGNADFLVGRARSAAVSAQQECVLLLNISNGLKSPLAGAPTSCLLSEFLPTPDQEAAIRSSNKAFPFKYKGEPINVSMSISLPLFDGFSRERNVQVSRIAVKDADLRIRSEELRIRTEVGSAYANASTSRQSVDLEARNRDLAAEQLELARERYRVGQGTFFELNDAQVVKARADQAYLNAVYSYHEALTSLETAVGQPLTQVTGGNR